MSDFDRFKFLELFASPPKAKRKRSSSKSRSKTSSEKQRQSAKIQKKEESETFLNTIAKLEKQPTMVGTSSSALKKQLSRTNLEQKYDSPDKSVIQNISCDEDKFIYQPAAKKESIAKQFFGGNYAQNAANLKVVKHEPQILYSDPIIFEFPSEAEVLRNLPKTLNSRLENLISSFKSPTRKVVKPGGFVERFRGVINKRKKDSLKGFNTLTYKELKEGEQKIKVISIALTSKSQYLIKFTFLDESEGAVMDGKENLASLRVSLYGEILKSYGQFIVRIAHSIEFKEATIMHDIEHMRAF